MSTSIKRINKQNEISMNISDDKNISEYTSENMLDDNIGELKSHIINILEILNTLNKDIIEIKKQINESKTENFLLEGGKSTQISAAHEEYLDKVISIKLDGVLTKVDKKLSELGTSINKNKIKQF